MINRAAMHPAARLLLFLLAAVCAEAHPILQNPVWIEACPESVTLKLDVSVRELIVVQGLPVASDGSVDLEEAIDLAPKHTGYLLDHFQVKADGKRLNGVVKEIVPPKKIGEGLEGPDRAHFRYTVEFPLAAPPDILTFSQNMCVEFPSAPGVPWDLSYAYRYGAPGETPMKFGAFTKDREYHFNTGFVARPDDGSGKSFDDAGETRPAAGSLVKEPMPGTMAALWALFIGAATLGGAALFRGKTFWLVALLIWMGGSLAGRYSGTHLPFWLVSLLCGVATILTAVDTVYRHSEQRGSVRWNVLINAGLFVFAAAFGLQQQTESIDDGWNIVPLPLAAVVLGVVCSMRLLARRAGERGAMLFSQILSLGVCASAIWLMLRLLEVGL